MLTGYRRLEHGFDAVFGAARNPLRHLGAQGLAALKAEHRIVAFGCNRGARVASLAAPDVAPISLMCIGLLPPAFIEYALRDGAAAVLVSGCREGACEFRLGQRWAQARLAGTREPHLRDSVARDRLASVWADAGDEAALHTTLNRLRNLLPSSAAPGALATPTGHG